MVSIHLTDSGVCDTCGGPLQSGPMGPQCMHCLLSFGMADEAFADVGELFPELNIQGEIARGGFGAVFRAEQRRMRRPVALKVLDSDVWNKPEAVDLFEREMVTVASLSHPGIVQAYDAGDREGQCYIVMELVDGEDCGALVRRHGRLPAVESCEIVRQAALALDHAHQKGLVHRDVKPGNLMISRESSTVKVLDFGLAAIAVAPLIGRGEAESAAKVEHRFLGTLEYIAPEQIEAPDHVDARADIYALGATLRRMLTGKPAREGMSEKTLMVQMKTVVSTPVEPIATLRSDLPKALAELCDRLLEQDPERRPATGAEVANLLEPWSAGAELGRLFDEAPLEEKAFVFPKRRRRLVAAGAVVVAVAGIVGLVLDGGKQEKSDSLPGVPVFSKAVAEIHRMDDKLLPRLLSNEWEVEREIFSATPVTEPIKAARLRPDGTLIFIQHHDWIFAEVKPGDGPAGAFPPGVVSGCNTLDVHPETGDLVWSRRSDPDDLALLRYRADGTALAPIGPDYSKEASEEARAAMRADRRAKGDHGGCAFVRGCDFVIEGNVPPNTGLRAGDVLYADEGHIDLALYPGRALFPRVEAFPGMWKFRFDNDEPAERIAALSTLWIKGNTNFPVAVTVSRHGVFLLNRNEQAPGPEVTENDYHRRVLRWDLDGFHECVTDLPIHRPAGIAADPLSADLYVLDGGSDVAPGASEQQVLRLRPDGANNYKVEVFVTKFMALSYCGIQITADGERMVLTDERLAAAVVLNRTALPAGEER